MLLNQASVNVGAVLAVVYGPVNLSLYDVVAFQLQNPDLVQTIDAFVDVAMSSAGPWARTLWNGLGQIAPGVVRSDFFKKSGQIWLRLVAVADGAGVNGVTLSATAEEDVPYVNSEGR